MGGWYGVSAVVHRMVRERSGGLKQKVDFEHAEKDEDIAHVLRTRKRLAKNRGLNTLTYPESIRVLLSTPPSISVSDQESPLASPVI